MKSKVSLGRANKSDDDDEPGDSKAHEGSDLLDMIAEAVKSVETQVNMAIWTI
jgi:hypothetical protein